MQKKEADEEIFTLQRNPTLPTFRPLSFPGAMLNIRIFSLPYILSRHFNYQFNWQWGH